MTRDVLAVVLRDPEIHVLCSQLDQWTDGSISQQHSLYDPHGGLQELSDELCLDWSHHFLLFPRH